MKHTHSICHACLDSIEKEAIEDTKLRERIYELENEVEKLKRINEAQRKFVEAYGEALNERKKYE